MGARDRAVLLVVDDEQDVRDVIAQIGTQAGFEVLTSPDGHHALRIMRERTVDLALVDVRMPEMDGLQVLQDVRRTAPGCDVILMTGYAAVDSAVQAIKLGARDYLSKPFQFDRLRALLADIRDEAERRRRVLRMEGDVARDLGLCGMVGRSAVMQDLFAMIRRLAPHVRVALITGETGTGKELVARALHTLGPRAGRRFVTVNCSAVVESLFEAEVFGHVRGAFTGATELRVGLFETADQGTLLLDEIGELSLPMQAKLLRAIETGEVQRVGNSTVRRVDVRVLAASNRDLRQEITKGRFRRDLFYRLGIVELELPPLRARREDIPYLTAVFVHECAERVGKEIVGPTHAAERLLVQAPWPGNVRELRNVIERCCLLAEGQFLTERDVAAALSSGTEVPQRDAVPAPALVPGNSQRLEDIERDHVRQVLEQAGGNKQAAARALGMSRRTLYRRLERWGLV